MRTTLLMSFCALSVAALAGSSARAEDLGGAELKDRISGRQVYLATPFGGEFPLNYRSDGTVDGSGKAIGLGRFMQPTDSGSWWVDGSKLCQKWKSWYAGKQFCFTIRSTGPAQIAWTRDDGLTGTARIAQ